MTIHRIGDYAVDYQLSALSDVAAKTKVMDDSLIAASATDITPAFIDYAGPLVGPMDSPTRLRAPSLNKILDSQINAHLSPMICKIVGDLDL